MTWKRFRLTVRMLASGRLVNPSLLNTNLYFFILRLIGTSYDGIAGRKVVSPGF